VDLAATGARRAALRAARVRVRLTAVGDLEAARGRLIRVDAATAARLGIGAGAIVELVNPRGAPLRAWVAGLLPGDGARAEIAPAALAMLAAGDAPVELRAVHSGALHAG
jgi:hypothetical protein